jgi:cellulose synthase operon protein C
VKRCLLVLSVLLGGCVTVRPVAPRFAVETSIHSAWEKASSGDLAQAKEMLSRVGTMSPDTRLALLLRTLIANEEARSVSALVDAVTVLETAPRVLGPIESMVDDAALSIVASLLGEASDRALEDRVLSLSPENRSWPAQMTLAVLWEQIARSRGDESLLAERARQSGCIDTFVRTGRAGGLPVGDLLSEPTNASKTNASLFASGCQQWLAPVDAQPGAEIVQSTFKTLSGLHAVALNFSGMAAFRIDGGTWHQHGSTKLYGPARSATFVALKGGNHTLELRLATYGAGASFSLAAFALSPNAAELDWRTAGNTPEAAGEAGVLLDLFLALAAHLEGDVDRMLEQSRRLGDSPRSPVVAAVLARLSLADPSRPSAMVRDHARSLFNRATQLAPSFARAWWSLAELEAQDGRNRNALRLTERVGAMAPAFWPNLLSTHRLASSLSLESLSDAALDAAIAAVDLGAHGQGGCAVLEAAATRAERRHRLEEEALYVKRLAVCDATSLHISSWLRQQRLFDDALIATNRVLRLFPGHGWIRDDRVSLLVAAGRTREAIETLRSDIAVFPAESARVLRLVDLLGSIGEHRSARSLLETSLAAFPVDAELRRAARAAGLALPLDAHRLDGLLVVKAFVSSGRQYQAPAVLILDRTVEQLHPDGSREILTHNIVRVQSKEGIDRWGEVSVPSGAELLRLRTIKSDGRVLQPESISGKETISAPELESGDYVEWETLELVAPISAFAPGFVGNRFFFQSPEAPLDRSEYWMVVPPGVELHMDVRAGAPKPLVESGQKRTQVWKFSARAMPQLFAERGSVDAREFIPSVRLSAGVGPGNWIRYLGERIRTAARGTPDLRRFAQKQFGGVADPAGAIVRWVGRHIENEGSWDSPASFALAKGRGSRIALILALGEAARLHVEPVVARSLNVTSADVASDIHNFEDYSEILLSFAPDKISGSPWQSAWRYAYPALRYAGLDHLPSNLAGAPAVLLNDERAKGFLPKNNLDDRQVIVEAAVAADGSARFEVEETLLGNPSYEWVESLEQLGDDKKKLNREFERGWLAHHFPGADLKRLVVQSDRETPEQTRLSYVFNVPGFAARQGDTLTVRPTFFGSNLGRRFASEAARTTTLFMARDIPLTMFVKMKFPAGSRVADAGLSEGLAVPVPGFVFDERRTAAGALGNQGATVVIERRVRVPIARITPANYPRLAPLLRKTEQLESSPVRVRLPAPSGVGDTGAP